MTIASFDCRNRCIVRENIGVVLQMGVMRIVIQAEVHYQIIQIP